jgi:hypothetical protein
MAGWEAGEPRDARADLEPEDRRIFQYQIRDVVALLRPLRDRGIRTIAVIVVVTVAGTAILLAVVVWSFPNVFLLAFASVLVALFLRTPVNAVRAHLSLSDGQALALVLGALLILAALCIWLLAVWVSSQFNDFSVELRLRRASRSRARCAGGYWGESG